MRRAGGGRSGSPKVQRRGAISANRERPVRPLEEGSLEGGLNAPAIGTGGPRRLKCHPAQSRFSRSARNSGRDLGSPPGRLGGIRSLMCPPPAVGAILFTAANWGHV